MKYKILMNGTNSVPIDDFFSRLEENFELQSCSVRVVDVKSHFKYFQPDILIYCMNREDSSKMRNMITLYEMSRKAGVVFAVLANEEDLFDYCKFYKEYLDLELPKSLSVTGMREVILHYMEEKKQKELEEQQKTQKKEEESETLAKEQSESETEAKKESVYIGDEEDETAASAVHTDHKGEKKTILVVDDDVRMIRAIKRVLDEEYHVASAVNGVVALRYLESKKADLVLLDYEMPQMGGPEVLQEIRNNEELASLPVVFLTGASEKDKIIKALGLRPQGYLLKPIEKDVLLEKIQEVLRA